MSGDTTIVTAFYDIGRSNWRAYPRSTEQYLERFSWLCQLENDMVIFTSPDMVETIKTITDKTPGRTIICAYDMLEEHKDLNADIARIQKLSTYQAQINPSQAHSPEYWCSEYVLVNLLKPTFINKAIDAGIVDDNFVAWVDFGFCRAPGDIGTKAKWTHNFNKDKIHFFSIKDIEPRPGLVPDAIFNNTVYTIGTYYVAHQSMWSTLKTLMDNMLNDYLLCNLMDDDQSVMLATYLSNPELFEIHYIHPSDWFVLFRKFGA